MNACFALFLMSGAIFLSTQTSDALYCYRCMDPAQSTDESSCSTRKNETCPSHLPHCVKWVSVVRGIWVTIKGCGKMSQPEGCKDDVVLHSPDFSRTTIVGGRACVCTTNLCNRAGSVVLQTDFLAILIITALLAVVWIQ